jgi:hypothetical protein
MGQSDGAIGGGAGLAEFAGGDISCPVTKSTSPSPSRSQSGLGVDSSAAKIMKSDAEYLIANCR